MSLTKPDVFTDHVYIKNLPRNCANHFCNNKIGEGSFTEVLLSTAVPKKKGAGMVKLFLCLPCAATLTEVVNDIYKEGLQALPEPSKGESPNVKRSAHRR